MSKYSKVFKEEIMEKHLSGSTPKELSQTYNVTSSTIYKWLKLHKQETAKPIKLMNVTSLIHEQAINFKLNGFLINIDDTNLEKLVKVLKQ